LRIYNRYVIALVISACLINTVLAFLGQDDLSIYFVINVITYLVITLLFAYLKPMVRRTLTTIGAVLFGGFMVVVILKAIEIWSGR
jgi:hypothetical protein